MRISLRVMMLSASIACCGTPSSASAQLQPLVMTHGIRSDASTWDNTAFQLGLAFPVSVRRYTTAWKTSYAAQANQLLGSVFVGVPDTTLAVGHSNGGLVLRQAAVSNAPLRGIATIGSPNFGAPAADAIRKNYMPDIIAPILITGQSISYVLSPPDPADPDEQWYYDYVVATGSNMVDLIEAILNLAEFDPSFGIWNSMYPTSPFMQEINSSASLATQAQRAPIRASIRTYLNNPDEAFWRLAIAQENVVYYTATRDFATLIALEAGFFFTDKYCYRQPYQNGKCNGASLFGQLASDLQLIEGRYCYKMQLEDAAGAYAMPCFSTDAVVPIERQMWGPQGFAVPYEFQGPSHTEQPRSASVRLALEAFLQTQANVARCGEGPAYQAQIAAQSTDILPNTTTALGVSVQDRCLTPLSGGTVISNVQSSNPSVATVSAGSNVVYVAGVGAGAATITAVVNGIHTSRVVAVGAGENLAAQIIGGPRDNLVTGQTVEFYATVSPAGQLVTYEWRVNGGAVMSTAAWYSHYFQGPATISLTVTSSAGQTAYATAEVSGSGTQFRIQRTQPKSSGRP